MTPPFTFEEWLKGNKLKDWPLDPEDENDNTIITADFIGLGSKEDIRNELKKKAPFQSAILDDVLKEVNSFEEKLKEYATFFFDKRTTKADAPQSNEKYRASFDLVVEQHHIKSNTSTIKKLFNTKLKNIENAVFPGFFLHELTPLPGAVEAPQLLNYVTKLQNFSSIYKKTWKRYFLSEASVAILQDAFWWIFLEKTRKDKECYAQAQLFNRLSKSFASLFISISYEEKDQFFQYYPDCLSQAIYSAFCAGFPTSSQIQFNEKFREKLLHLIYEWVAGASPHVTGLLALWDLEALESNKSKEDSDDINHMLKSRLSFNEETFLQTSPRNVDEENVGAVASPRRCTQDSTSHTSGPGPEYERIAFNIYGRSPFIMHYLASKDLHHENEVPQKLVTRTQINETKVNDEPTYKELIQGHRLKSTGRKKKFHKMTSQVAKDCQLIDQQKKKDLKTMVRAQEELMTKHFDIKILSENILDRMKFNYLH
ncbi:protein FAM227B-like isoform X2 [Hydractinia symbiolongicarpus]|uniref:protein FAM227B-like isoform X2 n=1 Tax=Hydractinia symbiolongicarpus TaxID=13093 RepID=UPI002550AE55|nr:protein FAM227B-like isoform X2 [Hydractinia symbiolongicarpus]